MNQRIKCTKCKSTLQIPDSARGKKVRCPQCEALLAVPAAKPASDTVKHPVPIAAVKVKAGPASPQSMPSGKMKIRCPGCKATLQFSSAMAGKVISCTKCGTKLKVPAKVTAASRQPNSSLPTQLNRPSTEHAFTPDPEHGDSAPAGQIDDLPLEANQEHDIFGSGLDNSGGGFGFNDPLATRPTVDSPLHASASNYSAPAAPRSASPPNYTIPAIALIVWGVLGVVIAVWRIGAIAVLLMFDERLNTMQINWPRLAGYIVGSLIGAAIFAGILVGGLAMLRRSGLVNARAGAILAAIPCFGIFVFPFGIWACVQLFSQRATRDFDR